MGVVYYANYLRYFEAGRNELLRALGVRYRDLEASGYSLPVASVEASYKAPARYDDELVLETRVVEVGRGTVRIDYRLARVEDDTLIAVGETTHACIGPSGRVSRIPDEIRKRITAD